MNYIKSYNEAIINVDDLSEIRKEFYRIKPFLFKCDDDFNLIKIINNVLAKFKIKFKLKYIDIEEDIHIHNEDYGIMNAYYDMARGFITILLFARIYNETIYENYFENKNFRNNYKNFVEIIIDMIEHETLHHIQTSKIKNLKDFLNKRGNRLRKIKNYIEMDVEYSNDKAEIMAHARDCIKSLRANNINSREDVFKILKNPFNEIDSDYKLKSYIEKYKSGILKPENWKLFLKYCYLYNEKI